jgi:rubrerythrin
MAFNPIQLRFIRFLGPGKEAVEFPFKSGFNILYGSSDTGKTFLVEAIDFMLGAGDDLRDIPERVGYDSILLGLTALGRDYTVQRSMNKGAFRLYDGLLTKIPDDPNAGSKLSAGHSSKNYNNLSNWLLQKIGLDGKEILYSKEKGTLKSLGFRALAHLCVIAYPRITSNKSPILTGQWSEITREYGVFRLLLTGLDDSSVTDEEMPDDAKPEIVRKPLSADAIAQMISDYEDELAIVTDNPDGLDKQESSVNAKIRELEETIRAMEGKINTTTKQRRETYETYARMTARHNEIVELLDRFQLLDQQYTNDLKRLAAIQQSGQFFVLREPMQCPLCGAPAEAQQHDAACDGNVDAVTQAAVAEIAKIKLLQSELHETVNSLTAENADVVKEVAQLGVELKGYQRQIENALSPDFAQARGQYTELIEKRAQIVQAITLRNRIKAMQRRLDEPIKPVRKEKPVAEEKSPEVAQYVSTSVLRDFSMTVGEILQQWHFPSATDVYFDEKTKDIVIGGRQRGSRGAGLCAITYSAFVLALFEYCRSRSMPHPGFVILDSPLIAYKEPVPDDENISASDLKPRVYEQLEKFAGSQQVFVIDNTDPPSEYATKGTHFTANEKYGRYGLFPPLKKP